MKSSQSNFNLRSPSSYLARSYLIATVSYYNCILLDRRGMLGQPCSTWQELYVVEKLF